MKRVVSGIVSGVAATGAMSVVLALTKRIGLLGEPPPRLLTRRTFARLGLPFRRRATLNVATAVAHFGYGMAMGLAYGALPRRARSVPAGAFFGAGVWAASYAGWIPKLGLMRSPVWDRPGRPTAMVLAHLVFGTTLGFVDQELAASRPRLSRRSARIRHADRRGAPPRRLSPLRAPVAE